MDKDLSKAIKTIETNLLVTSGFSHVSGQIDELKELLRQKVAVVPFKDAIKGFRAHIEKKHKQPRNFKYLLECLENRFEGDRNLAEINSLEMEDFLCSRWKGNSFNAYRSRLSSFIVWAIKQQRRQNLPVFVNAVEFIQPNREVRRDFEYQPPEVMRKLLDMAGSTQIWLWLAIPLVSGIRFKELWMLRPQDINGRILILDSYEIDGKLMGPKSGKPREWAIIPELVMDRLEEYIDEKEIASHERIWPCQASTLNSRINETLIRLTGKLGFRFTLHDMRRWLSTFYSRHGDMDMVRYTLRHSSIPGQMTSLEGRYLGIINNNEACKKQSKLLVPELFGEESR